MTDEELHELEGVASPGAGACGAQFTANTMACAFEALGISVGGSAMVPAEDEEKGTVAEQVGEMIMRVLAEDLRPSRIITSESLENAIACICASGGSTNGVLHMLAVAREAGVPLEMADFERISEPDPAVRRHEAGRPLRRDRPLSGRRGPVAPQPPLRRRVAASRADHRHAVGRSARRPTPSSRQAGQDVVRPATDPVKPQGGLAILHGNLAPEGAVVKVAGTERLRPDRARPGSSSARRTASRWSRPGGINPGDVIVIRNEGPTGGPGMREMLQVTAAIVGERPWR